VNFPPHTLLPIAPTPIDPIASVQSGGRVPVAARPTLPTHTILPIAQGPLDTDAISVQPATASAANQGNLVSARLISRLYRQPG